VGLDLEFDDAQQAIHDATSQFCRDHCDAAAVKAATGHFAPGLWKGIAELGVLALATADGDGGAVELLAAVEALGRAVFPGPLAASVFAAQILPARERAAVTSGTAVVSLGRPPLFAWAPVAQIFVELDGERAHLVRPLGAIEPVQTLGGEPWGRVRLEREAALGDARRALALHDSVLAAYLAAAASGLVEATAEHARTRRQFGRAIGEFQAVAHPLADCAIRLGAATTLARAAAARWERAADESGLVAALRAAAAARLSAARAALAAAHTCHQLFGAVGITLEGPVFHVSRRIRQLATHPVGDAPAHAAVLATFGL
jgi:alkylation response protein AidB-like acyl-CoA dehydrogenase